MPVCPSLQIAHLRHLGDEGENTIRELRWTYGLRPVYKTVDTCAAEFDAATPYYYSCYADETEVKPREREAVIILGSGPNRIGQGIEFDYTCVHAVQELGKDYDTIMVNCNPETVSTDYDISDRLYFEPLTFEDVLEIYEAEKKMGPVKGVIVQLGGQTPLSLAARLKAAGVPILGTTPEAIDLAENRELFGEVLKKAKMNAPRYGTALSLEEAQEAAHSIGYPVLVRPSYVLGGRGMEIVYDNAQLEKYVERALDEAKADTVVSGRLPSPLLIDKFLQDAIEIDVDALFDGEELYIGGIMEHIEEAGVHSGDAACTLPPNTLSVDQIRRLREGTYAIAKGCNVQGLINVQYAFMANTLYVIEANPRASRTVPFASKATGVPLAKAAARIMAGETIAQQRANGLLLPKGDGGDFHPGQQIAVKESVLPFKRFRTPLGKTVDVLLGPEMRSTGEVMGFDRDVPHAFAKSQLAAYDGGLPTEGNVFVSVNDSDKRQLPLIAVRLEELGFEDLGDRGHRFRAAPLWHRIEDRGQDLRPCRLRPGRSGGHQACRRLRGQERGSAHRRGRDRHDSQHPELARISCGRLFDSCRRHRRGSAAVHHHHRIQRRAARHRRGQAQRLPGDEHSGTRTAVVRPGKRRTLR